MNITYIIGNGFDISKGFDTSYEAYYNYLESNKTKYSGMDDIIESINKYKEKLGDIDWSDFEEGLLDYISKNCTCMSVDRCKSKISLCILSLIDFLRSVESELNNYVMYSNNQDEIYTPFSFCEEENKKSIIRMKRNYGSKNTINVVSLNYTRVCTYYFGSFVNEFINLHGILDSTPIALGVDNQEQFDLKNITKEYKDTLSKYICKNVVVKNHLSGTNDDFIKILSDTHLFVFYGTSFGRTDETLWKKIGESIVNNDAIVIVSCYKDYVNPSSTVEYVDFVEDKRRKMCNILCIDSEKYANKIFLVDSKKILKGNFEKKPQLKKLNMIAM